MRNLYAGQEATEPDMEQWTGWISLQPLAARDSQQSYPTPKFKSTSSLVISSVPITSWQIDEETVERQTNFILGGSKITADDDCSHENKRCLLLASKTMTKLDSVLKSRDITLPSEVHIVKAIVFPVVMYGW